MKVGILSDTHGLLRPEVLENLRGVDLMLHGGDYKRQAEHHKNHHTTFGIAGYVEVPRSELPEYISIWLGDAQPIFMSKIGTE